MSSLNHRSSQVTTRSISTRHNSEGNRRVARRSRSQNVATHQEFIIVLTNCPSILRRRTSFRLRVRPHVQSTGAAQEDINDRQTLSSDHSCHLNNREDVLANLLQVELSEAIQDYVSRTRRSYPIHFLFDMSQIEFPQQQQQQQHHHRE